MSGATVPRFPIHARYPGIRDNPDAFAAGLKRRGLDGAAIAGDLLARDKALRDLLTRLQTEQARRNEASKLIGQAKAKKDEAQAKALMEEVAGLKEAIQQGEAEQRDAGSGACAMRWR